MKIKLQKGLFIGDFPLSQTFGNKLIINGVDIYAQFGMLGHNGLDYAVPSGTILTSCINGTVIENGYDKDGYGYYLKIENDYCGVIYAHMKKKSDYLPGMKVPVGAEIGISGNTGNSTGSHLHFGVFPKPRDRSNGYAGYIDPLGDQIEWVDSLVEEDNTLSKLQEKITSLEKSIESWKKEYEKVSTKAESLNKILNDVAEVYGMEDFDYKTQSKTLLYKANSAFSAMTQLNDNSIGFSLMHKDIKIIITSQEEVRREV